MGTGIITLIGASKLGARFYDEESEIYDIRVVGTKWQQFRKFEDLPVQNTYIIDDEPFGLEASLHNAEYVVCAIAPSHTRMVDGMKAGKKLFDIYDEVYCNLAYKLVKLLPKFPTIKHLLWCSSTGVYGDHDGEPVDENSPSKLPEDDPRRKVLEAEHIINVLGYQGIKLTKLRFGFLYSKKRSIQAVYEMAKTALNTKSNRNYFNLTHETDAMSAICHCLCYEVYGTYNVTNDLNQIPYGALVEQIAAHYHFPRLLANLEGKNLSTNCRVVSDAIKDTGFKFQYPTSFE